MSAVVKIEIEVDLPDDCMIREGVLVLAGLTRDGHFWKTAPYEDTSVFTQSDLCRRAHVHFEREVIPKQRKA